MKILSLLLALFSSFSHASTAEPLSKWPKKDLTICWLDQDRFNVEQFSDEAIHEVRALLPVQVTVADEFKTFIQTNIQKEFTSERTGIHFVGWKSCKDTKKADVQIVTGNKDLAGYGLATHGRISHIKEDKEYEFLKGHSYIYVDMGEIKSKLPKPWDTYLTFLHELGHIAGLRHEQIRPEAAADLACKSMNNGPHLEAPYKHTANLGPYDPTSIMNDCFTGVFSYHTGLKFIAFDGTQQIIGKFRNSFIKHWTDETIVSRVKRDDSMDDVMIRIGLSKGDVEGLKKLYP